MSVMSQRVEWNDKSFSWFWNLQLPFSLTASFLCTLPAPPPPPSRKSMEHQEGKVCGCGGEAHRPLHLSFPATHTDTFSPTPPKWWHICLRQKSSSIQQPSNPHCCTFGFVTASVLEWDQVWPCNERRTDTLTFSQPVVCLCLHTEDQRAPISLVWKGCC